MKSETRAEYETGVRLESGAVGGESEGKGIEATGGPGASGVLPDLKVHVGLVGGETDSAQRPHTDALLQQAAGWGHEAWQGQGDAQERGWAMSVVPKHA